MKQRLPLYIFIAFFIAGLAACNSEYDVQTYEDTTAGRAEITAFSLEKNDSILENLDSVFFAIDLKEARIYNADSLPKGTEFGKVVVKMTVPSARAVQIIIPTTTYDADTIDYLEHSSDSVDFSKGYVYVRVTSEDNIVRRDYRVKINVHESIPDSLYWNQLAMRSLPTSLTGITAQKTVVYKGMVRCFTTDGSRMCMASIANPGLGEWTYAEVSLPDGADLSTLTAADNVLYVLAGGSLWSSADGNAWTDTGTEMCHIYCGYGDMALGVKKDSNGKYFHVTYPATTEQPVEASCPVSGTSQAMTFSTSWSSYPMTMFIGGRCADGSLSGATWGYDGTRWANVCLAPTTPHEGMVFFPYYSFSTNNQWITTQYPTLFAFGGRNADGTLDNTVYISRDQGVHWKKGDDYIQLPDYIAPLLSRQAYVYSETIDASRAVSSGWTSYPSLRLPAWCHLETGFQSRISAPITSWECPYIYLFGGVDAKGNLSDTLWRGVINRLRFKPIY